MNRLLLNEIVAKFSELAAVEVEASNGERDRLIALIQKRYEFSQSRAQREVDNVLADFSERLHRATAA
jgi:hypothetical protein